MQSKLNYIQDVSARIKKNNIQISNDKSELNDKIIDLKKKMEIKEMSDKYSDNLRKELYKRNVSINNKYQDILKY